MAITRVRWKRGTAADWTSADTVLRLGEPGYETDTNKVKVGDGVTAWNSLPYLVTGGGGGGGSFDATALASVMHAATGKTTLADNDEFAVIDSAASNGLKKYLVSSLKTLISSLWAPSAHAFTAKATPVDADEIAFTDSAASFAGKKMTWANAKAALKAQVSVNDFAAADGSLAMGANKITGLADGTGNTDSATLGQVLQLLSGYLEIDELLDTYLNFMSGTPKMVIYDTVAGAWPTQDSGLLADERVGWIFLYSDEGDPPPGAPTVAGPRLWARLV